MSNPTGSRHPEDRALNAVHRVRFSREEDSRVGLQHALTLARSRRAELDEASARLAAAPGFAGGSIADFTSYLHHGKALVAQEQQARVRVRDSRLVADEAERRWQLDRRQVRVVDLLLERRAQARAEERARREARELDDLASSSWLRNRVEGGSR
jgi:flagellar FliJ protein